MITPCTTSSSTNVIFRQGITELNSYEHYTKIISNLLGPLKDQKNAEYSLSYFKNDIIDFCGPIDMLTCLAPGNKLNDLAHRFYWNLHNYDEATKIYQYLTDKANLSSLEGNARNEVIANLQVFYYRLGMMNLKRNKYYTARQNFIAAVAIGDITGDGNNEIVVAGSNSPMSDHELRLFKYNSDSTDYELIDSTTMDYYAGSYNSLQVVDIDNDGNNEVIVALYYAGIRIY